MIKKGARLLVRYYYMHTKHCSCGLEMQFVSRWDKNSFYIGENAECTGYSSGQCEVFPYPSELKPNCYFVSGGGKQTQGIFPSSVYCKCGKIHRTKTFGKTVVERDF